MRYPLLTTTALGHLFIASAVFAGDKHWAVEDGNWNVGANWSPVGAPAPADDVFVGSTLAAENGWASMNVNVSVASITITDGMMLDTNGFQLIVPGLVSMSGRNLVMKGQVQVAYPSRLRVDQGPGLPDATIGSIDVDNEALLEIWNGATLRVTNLLDIGNTGAVSAEGVIQLTGNGAVAMRVNGTLGAGVDDLVVTQLGAGRIDLDGNVEGDSTISVASGMIDGSNYSEMSLSGDQLFDSMGDNIAIGGNNRLTMNFSNGWQMNSNATLTFYSNGEHPGPARLEGTHVDMLADFTFPGTGSHGQINAPVTLHTTVFADLGPEDFLECTNTTVIEGGTYTLGEDALVRFEGATTVQGGTFNTFSDFVTDGSVNFVGATTWNGTIQVNGNAHQLGNATVTGPTVINGDVFNLDGGGTAAWTIGNNLTLNVDRLEDSGIDKFDGTLDISGGFLSKLTVNGLASGSWRMDGTMNTSGVAAILTQRLDGQAMSLFGDLNVTNKVGFDAETRFEAGSVTDFAAATTELHLTAGGTINAGALFTGDGAIHVPSGAIIKLKDGADTDNVGLVCNGTLEVGNSPGAAFVDRLTLGSTAAWIVELGGYTPDVQHDLLFVLNDPAQLGGGLFVKLLDLGGGTFDPIPGDSFAVLRASAGMAGAFVNTPVSYASGKVYLWEIEYSNPFVYVTLDEVLPCPADLNSDGMVDGADLGILLGEWGLGKSMADFNSDAQVDGADLGVLLGEWGPCL